MGNHKMKYPNPLSIRFGAELRSAIRKSGKRQTALADHLGVTPAAITQMTGGRMLPPRENLEKIFLFIGMDAAGMDRLRTLWSRCRLGEDRERSQLNCRLSDLRCERGLSQNQLALQTNMTNERIRTLCEDPEAEALPDEKVALARVLGCKPEFLVNADYSYFSSEPLGVGESGEGPSTLPVTISLMDMSICTEASALPQFFKLVQKDGDRLLIRAESSRLGMAPGATILMLAALERRSDFFSVDLVRMRDGIFRLCGGGVFPPLPKPREYLWKLPVLEVRICPGK